MHAHQGRLDGVQVSQHVGDVLVAVERGAVGVGGEVAVLRRNARRGEVLDQLLVPAPVADQVGDRDEEQAVLLGELDQLGQARHGTVVVHDLAEHAHQLPVREGTQVDAGLGVAGPLEHAAGTGTQREDVAGSGELAPNPTGVGEGVDGE